MAVTEVSRMNGKIMGCDISHHNVNTELVSGLSFYFIKATEGKNWVDNAMTALMLKSWDKSVMMLNPIFGFYHYARPDINSDPIVEAEHFLKTIQPHIGASLFALDWEGNSVTYPTRWALDWLTYVEQKTGIKPFFYASAAYIKKMSDEKEGTPSRIILDKYPLWVAHYGDENKYSEFKKEGNIWQFTSDPMDFDIYYGTYLELALKGMRGGN